MFIIAADHLHLKVDVLLLADVFGIFRINIIKSFEFHPAHYLSTAVYRLDTVLGSTDVWSKLIPDIKN